MRNRGLSRPWTNVLLSLALLLATIWAVWTGALEMEDDDGPFAFATLKFVAGIVAGLVAVVALPNFLRGAAVFRTIRSGRNEVARWTVSAAELDEFRANDAARNALGPAYDNDWRLPRVSPQDGLEVIFAEDGVLVGGTYFPLVTTGLFTFSGVQMVPGNPLAIEFGMVAISASDTGTVHVHTFRSLLRIPVARLARPGAVKVLDFFKRVDAGQIIVNAEFYPRCVKLGLATAAVSFLAAVYGYWRAFYDGQPDDFALVALVAGVMAGLGSLMVATVAWLLGKAQRGRL